MVLNCRRVWSIFWALHRATPGHRLYINDANQAGHRDWHNSQDGLLITISSVAGPFNWSLIMDAEKLGVGKLITTAQQRDAIHVAILPVYAGCRLIPGAHIEINNLGIAGYFGGKHCAIVDPFLEKPVEIGDQFWAFMYPGSINSLRHDWTHKDVKCDNYALGVDYRFNIKSDDPNDTPKINLLLAKCWLTEFAKELNRIASRYEGFTANYYNYDRLLEIGRDCLTGGAHAGNDDTRDYFNEHKEEFLRHVGVILGKEIEPENVYFSCGC